MRFIQKTMFVACAGIVFALAGCDNDTQKVTAKKMIQENTANPFAPGAQSGPSNSKPESGAESAKQDK